MASWTNPVPAVTPLDSNVLRVIFASLEKWTTSVGGSGGTTTLRYGSSNPTPSTGSNGDFYINTTNLTIFGPKASGVWPSGTSLIGTSGSTGAAGPQGPQGPMGGTYNVDGGDPSSVYGGILPLDAGGI